MMNLIPPPKWGTVLIFSDDLRYGLVEIAGKEYPFSLTSFKPGLGSFRRPKDRELVFVYFTSAGQVDYLLPKDLVPDTPPAILSWFERLKYSRL